MYKKIFVLLMLILMLSFNYADLTTDLVSYWDFDEASGKLLDKHGSNDATNSNVTYEETGVINDSYGYVRTNSSKSTLDSTTGFDVDSFSISVWSRGNSTNINENIFTCHGDATNYFRLWRQGSASSIGYDFGVKIAGTWKDVQSNIENTTWNHLVATYDGSTLELYVNGSRIGTGTAQTGTFSLTNCYFGVDHDGTADLCDGNIDEAGIWSRVLTSDEASELYNSGDGLAYPFADSESIDANFSYIVNTNSGEVELTDTSTASGTSIDGWSWLVDGSEEGTTQDYDYATTQNQDLNICLIIDNSTDTLTDSICQAVSTGNWITSKFDYVINQSAATIELTDDSNTASLAIANWSWEINGDVKATTADYDFTTAVQLTDYNTCLTVSNAISTDSNCYTITTGDWEDPETTFSSSQISQTTNNTLTLTCTDNNSGCKYINFRVNGEDWNYYTIGDNPLEIIYAGTGDHNIQYYSTDNSDNNEAINTTNFSTYGLLKFNFYNDSGSSLTAVYLEFDGNANYSGANNYVYIDLEGITSGSKNLLMQVTGYQEKDFYLTFNEFSDYDYNMGFVPSSELSDVAFQVFTLTGALKTNTSFAGYDSDNNFLIDVKTTDATGKVNFYLNNTKSEYFFDATDMNFSTTTWTINKPKDATTLLDIDGNWKYSITGNSYSYETEIASDVTKLLLQNTVNPYYIKIQDQDEAYALSNFGLKSVTSEPTRTLNPYLYPFGSASLILIKLLDFSTNQPIASFNELQLSLYTDANGLIEIGTFINDSTGTYNIYMDQNEKYELIIESQTFILNPTLNIYYLYLTQASGLDPINDVNIVDNNFTDLNSPVIFSEVRQYFFGCSAEEENCYPSMLFSLIFLVILAVGLSVYLTVGSLEQSILIIVLLGVFTFIGFIPLWLFAITAVVSFMWGVFS